MGIDKIIVFFDNVTLSLFNNNNRLLESFASISLAFLFLLQRCFFLISLRIHYNTYSLTFITDFQCEDFIHILKEFAKPVKRSIVLNSHSSTHRLYGVCQSNCTNKQSGLPLRQFDLYSPLSSSLL